uniref:Timeless N-terminal domain-containing protein n=1 Tax=Gopherus agassizii TaxID=38772 RepID=A0A452GRM5_9SAUR
MMNCELLATCSALGYLEGDVYHKEPDCLESVKDLIRYLRYEDETRDVRQQLGAAQILQNDLLPLITQYLQDKLLFDAVVRLMVNLTQPALLCFGKVPRDPGSRHCFLQVVSYLQAYKEAFASAKVFGVLSEKLYDLLQLDWEQRQEEDNLLVERILLLVRNVLHIPTDPEEDKSVDDDASTHDRVLWAIHVSGMDDLLKFLASSSAEQQWSLHVLEIISLMFRDQVSPGGEQGARDRRLAGLIHIQGGKRCMLVWGGRTYSSQLCQGAGGRHLCAWGCWCLSKRPSTEPLAAGLATPPTRGLSRAQGLHPAPQPGRVVPAGIRCPSSSSPPSPRPVEQC